MVKIALDGRKSLSFALSLSPYLPLFLTLSSSLVHPLSFSLSPSLSPLTLSPSLSHPLSLALSPSLSLTHTLSRSLALTLDPRRLIARETVVKIALDGREKASAAEATLTQAHPTPS